MDTSSYLDRIGYRCLVRPSLDVLRRLHLQHLLSVPFENLDIHLGRPITLDPQNFYDKIVAGRRGGYCYELNGSFAWLLRSLGFRVTMLSARVAGKNGIFSPEFDHMALLVRLGERWLADVGFGDLFTMPLRLDAPDPQGDDGRLFRISKEKTTRILSRWDEENRAWKPQYSFRLQVRRLSDFAMRNQYQQTSPESHFTKRRMITRLLPEGRVTLTDRKLILTAGNKRVERPVKNGRMFDRLLAQHFDVRLG